MLTRQYVELMVLKDRVKERFIEAFRRVREEKDGAAMVEYGILIAGIAVAVMAIVFSLGLVISGKFTEVKDKISPPAQ